ncbi:hypothetical protein FB446DRAFT_788310 [Lentinula raphanica]|nr:hypothetical protein FB446DRAFT_788310 [Lentinula raphanica]
MLTFVLSSTLPIQFDSVSAIVLRLRANRTVRAPKDRDEKSQLDIGEIKRRYANRALRSTASQVSNLIVGSINNCAEDTEPTMAISRMVSKYSQDLDPPIQTVPNGTHSQIH